MNDVGIDAMDHRDLGNRRTRLVTLSQHLRLLHGAVPPPRLLVACHRVHLSLRGQHPCRRRLPVQDEFAGRLRRFGSVRVQRPSTAMSVLPPHL